MSIIQAIIIMLVVAEHFLYKQKHRMIIRAAEKRLAMQKMEKGVEEP